MSACTKPCRNLRYLASLGLICGSVGFSDGRVHGQGKADASIEIADAQVSYIQNTFIASPIAGIVDSIEVSEGGIVEKDQLLIQLDDRLVHTEYEATVAAMQAAKMQGDNDIDARYARRALEFQLRELNQSELANARFSGAVSDSEVEKLRLGVEQARLAIEQAEHEQAVAKSHASEKQAAVKIAQQRIDAHSIKASVSGLVVEIAVQRGEWVDAGKPVARVISVDPIRVECFVDGRVFGSELVGRSIDFIGDPSQEPQTDSLKKQPRFRGRVVFVSPELHPVTGQVRLWGTVENPGGRLRGGMRGRVLIGSAP